MSIKIAIIAHSCRSGGGLIQTKNLLKALKNVVQDEKFLIVYSAGYGFEEIIFPDNTDLYIYKGRHNPLERYWFEFITLPKIVNRYNPDIIYGPGNIGLTNPPAPQALYIRQAYLFCEDKRRYPHMHLRFRLRLASLKLQIKRSLPGTKLIFCQTSVVKQRFSEKYNYPQSQMKILGFPPPTEMTAAGGSQTPSVFDRDSGNFYILLLTDYMAHRNPSVLIPFCRRYGVRIRKEKIKFITTIEPLDHPRASSFLKGISRYHLEDIIINVGQISRQDIARYLRCSDVMWLPTLLECLPTSYLEAMFVGTPIIAPDLDFAKYVCDDAAVYYDPWNLGTIFEKIMLLRKSRQFREGLVEKGKMQLQNKDKFPQSWDEVAKITLQELHKLSPK